MKCPVCAATALVMTERCGIEIDYCPACRGIWLDRGELDKIIARSLQSDGVLGSSRESNRLESRGYAQTQNTHHGHHTPQRSHHGKKSFFQELFD